MKLLASSAEIEFQRLRKRDEGAAHARGDAAPAAFLAWNAGAGGRRGWAGGRSLPRKRQS
jgi:hypothetical protein